MATKVQIYLGSATTNDALMCVESGADFIGMVGDERLIADKEFSGGVLPSTREVSEIFAALPAETMKVALTFESEIPPILEMARTINPQVIHLAGKATMSVKSIAALRTHLPGIKIMQAIAVNRPNPIDIALSYQAVCDYFLLDSKGDEKDHPYGVGGTGTTHDWQISADLVKKASIPVILAGGLSSDNIGKAISVVAPWGVDSFTHTNVVPRADSVKDAQKVKIFVDNAKRAGE